MKNIHHHNRNDLLQPLRSKEPVKNDRKFEKPAPSTPDFEKKKQVGMQVSPISKKHEKESKSTSKQGGYDSVSKSTTVKVHLKQKVKIVDKEEKISLAKQEQDPLDSSFEEEEKRIRRESLARDFVSILANKEATLIEDAGSFLIDYLKKSAKVYEVHVEYADELRSVNLKKNFFTNIRIAVEEYRYRFKLIRNFARILGRFLQKPVELTLRSSFKDIKNLKRPIYKPSTKAPKKTYVSPSVHNNSNYRSNVQTPQETTLTSSNPDVKRAPISKTPRIKKETTPVKSVNFSKSHKPAKIEGKTHIPPQKVSSSHKKKTLINSSLDENIYRSKRGGTSSLENSVEKNLRNSTEVTSVKTKEILSETSSHPKLTDNSQEIISKHQEIKNRLLQQMRGKIDRSEEEEVSRNFRESKEGQQSTKIEEDTRNDEDIHGRKLCGTLL